MFEKVHQNETTSKREKSKQFWFWINWKFIKRRYQNEHQTFKNTSKQACHRCVNFQFIKIGSKKYIEMTLLFGQSKLHQEGTSKRNQFFAHRNYVGESMWKRCWFFVHQKSTSKWRGNLLIFSFRCIEVIST